MKNKNLRNNKMVLKCIVIETTKDNTGLWSIDMHNSLVERLNILFGTIERGANGGDGSYYTNAEEAYEIDNHPILKKLHLSGSLGTTMIDTLSGAFFTITALDPYYQSNNGA